MRLAIHPGPVDDAFQHAIEVTATGLEERRAAGVFDDMIPLGRHASPDEIARAVLSLASEESSFLTGATIPVDAECQHESVQPLNIRGL